MKRIAIIVVVLIALTAILGVRYWGEKTRPLPPSGSVPDAQPMSHQADSKGIEPGTSHKDENALSTKVTQLTKQSPVSPAKTISINSISSQHSAMARSTRENSPIRFIRTSVILGTREPSKEEIEHLREAVALVGESLYPGALIIDADGLSAMKAPVLLYARDAFDLTDQVKSVYVNLRASSGNSTHENTKVE